MWGEERGRDEGSKLVCFNLRVLKIFQVFKIDGEEKYTLKQTQEESKQPLSQQLLLKKKKLGCSLKYFVAALQLHPPQGLHIHSLPTLNLHPRNKDGAAALDKKMEALLSAEVS